MNSVSIAIFTALLGLLVIVRLAKLEYMKKSHFTMVILAFIAVGCTIEVFLNIAKWRIAASWTLVALACIILCINILISEHYYLKNHIEEDDEDMDEVVEEFQEFEEAEQEEPEDIFIDTKDAKAQAKSVDKTI